MKPEQLTDLSRLCIHSITTKPLDITSAVNKYASLGVSGITIWRDAYGDYTPLQIGKMIGRSGLEPVSLCRGGFFPSVDERKRKAAVNDNLTALEEASDMEMPMLVLVCGADPQQLPEVSREQIKAGIEAILPRAEKLKIKLAIEPLHPLYADTRSAINTMKQANDLAGYFNSPWVGVAVDVYHVWWDEDLFGEIVRCGKDDKLFAFHVCDWKVPTGDFLLDRGVMGEGCIDIPGIRGWMNRSGFKGFNEVEIFSQIYWKTNQDEYLNRIIDSYLTHT